MSTISSLHARQIFDSRGRPTVEVDVRLDNGILGRASVPSGASTGSYEAHERRDGVPTEYGGLGVGHAVDAVNGEIAAAVKGRAVDDQAGIDGLLRELDGTAQLKRLGANAVLGTSLAVCRTAALDQRVPLYRRIAELAEVPAPLLPMPMVNILSGGLHAGRGMDVQDFLIIPCGARDIPHALKIVADVRDTASVVSRERGLPTLLADEGGLSPGLRTAEEALSLLVDIIERAGYKPGDEVEIAIDVAAHSLAKEGRYELTREGVTRTSEEMIDAVTNWVDNFPIASIEDALDEEDWSGWAMLTQRLGSRIKLIGDDLFTTNSGRVQRGIAEKSGNGVLVKVNQNGTLTGTLDVVRLAREAGFTAIVSARSGETEDDFLADLAVGTATGQIKVGSLRCSDRLSKYNQLLRIAEDESLAMADPKADAGR